MTGIDSRCRGYLVVGAGPGGPEPGALARALREAEVACVLLAGGVGPADRRRLSDLIRAAQSQDAAALLEGDARLAAELGADGVHLGRESDPDVAAAAYAQARQILGASAIVGADGSGSRHGAMVLGELGADYIAFAPAGDEAEARTARLDMLAWWAELFEVPCVAWDVTDAAEGGDLVMAGADFLACRASEGAALAGAIDLLARVLGRGGPA